MKAISGGKNRQCERVIARDEAETSAPLSVKGGDDGRDDANRRSLISWAAFAGRVCASARQHRDQE
jgi:hypothetical protein